MIVRPARPEDVDGVFAVRTSVRENHLSMEQLAALGIRPEDTPASWARGETRCWVAEEDGEIVAFSAVIPAEATVWAMFVHPDHEGRGIGRALMAEAESSLFADGRDEIWLLTDRDPKVRANGLYQRLGWAPRGVQPDGQMKYTKRAR